MSLKEQIEADLKTAMLAGDKTLVTTIRGLKSAILNEEIAKDSREQGLSDPEVISVLNKEAKKRQDSADMYKQGGATEREQAELAEKMVIEKYLPRPMSDDQLNQLIDKSIEAAGGLSPQTMGKIIGSVKQQSDGQADGGRIATAIKARLEP
ncbi:MAG TPA: GatB/YqeY domain-containing protein [Candidatus Saccharimonadales bacterium]|nr:GatB/YqeY domain-containing protein [Candidatus Saccharimonadales bacterium]